jgi:hypothetical protein
VLINEKKKEIQSKFIFQKRRKITLINKKNTKFWQHKDFPNEKKKRNTIEVYFSKTTENYAN